jgi:hypothetical protein
MHGEKENFSPGPDQLMQLPPERLSVPRWRTILMNGRVMRALVTIRKPGFFRKKFTER